VIAPGASFTDCAVETASPGDSNNFEGCLAALATSVRVAAAAPAEASPFVATVTITPTGDVAVLMPS
jgi:hypothetical protein